ncbi:MAG: arylsulfotransferase family protein, partial [Trebonia sp.]
MADPHGAPSAPRGDGDEPEGDGAAASTLGRRRFLALLGQTAAGAGGLLAGCGGSAQPTRTKVALPSKYSEDAVASRAAASDQTQSFYSRPDLRPPRITLTRAERRADGLVFTETHAGNGQQGPLLIDGSGRLVWFLPVSDHGTTRTRTFNVRVQTYRGRRLMTFFRGAVVSGHGQGHYELWDDGYRRVGEVHGANGYLGDLHEFLITDRGTALFTCYGQAQGEIPNHSGGGTRDGAFFYGVAQEVDIATGKLLFQWRSIDHVPVQDSYHLPPPSNPQAAWDYVHINSIAIDPSDDNLLISSRNTWTVYKVDRTSGR